MVGNAVSVPVAQWIGERLKAMGGTVERSDEPIPAGSKWPAAAWQVDPSGPRFAAPVGADGPSGETAPHCFQSSLRGIRSVRRSP